MNETQLNKILERCLKNDRMAQEALYKHFFGLMYHICSGFAGDREEILSLMNQGFLKIFTSLNQFQHSIGSFESWAKKIMVNNGIDYQRKQLKAQHPLSIDAAVSVSDDLTTYSRIAEKEIMECLKQLPEATRNVFQLHVFNGFSHREISDTLKIAESTSRWHVLEARKTLKKFSKEIV